MSMGKWKRRALITVLAPLPRDRAKTLYHWVEGRRVAKQLRHADVVFASLPKSGRTWLRVMLWHFYRQRYGVREDSPKRLEKMGRRLDGLPIMLFTHDNHLRHYLKQADPAARYQGKKVVLMIRDPRDGAVSMYYQWRYRTAPSKKHFSKHGNRKYSLVDFILGSPQMQGILFRRINVLNRWGKAIPRMNDILVVRYEDLRQDPEVGLARVLQFIGSPAEDHEIKEAVAFASFEKMQEREAAAGRDAPSRLRPGNPSRTKSFKSRRGKVGGYRDYFDEETLSKMDSIVESQLDPMFGYVGTDDHFEKVQKITVLDG
jgi:hypothetical protein